MGRCHPLMRHPPPASRLIDSRRVHRVYHQGLLIRYQFARTTQSQESRQIVASLAHRVGPDADSARIAQALATTLQDMDAALAPIIGKQGVVALYCRSLHLCTARHPHLAVICASVPQSLDVLALESVLVEQSDAQALFFSEVMLTTVYELLTTLIGPSLTARLLRDVWGPSLSDTPSQEISP